MHPHLLHLLVRAIGLLGRGGPQTLIDLQRAMMGTSWWIKIHRREAANDTRPPDVGAANDTQWHDSEPSE